MKFRTLLVDPPWEYRVWTAKGGHKSASAHYDTQTSSWVENLPVAQVCEPDCCLFLWATWPTLPDALKVIEAWGFTYKTLGFDWIKLVNRAVLDRLAGAGYRVTRGYADRYHIQREGNQAEGGYEGIFGKRDWVRKTIRLFEGPEEVRLVVDADTEGRGGFQLVMQAVEA